MLDKKALSLDVAKQIAAAAEAEAGRNQWAVAISIMDDGGNLLLLQRMDHTQIGSVQVSQDKARSALLFKRPTKAFEESYNSGRTQLVALKGAIPIEGGLPLYYQNAIVGSIGVSGVQSNQDGQIAQAGAAWLAKLS